MKLIRVALVAVLFLTLPSCEDQTSTPTQPTPQLGPAQLTFSVQFTQAAAVANIEVATVQSRTALGNIFIDALPNTRAGSLSSYLAVIALEPGGTQVVNETVTPAGGISVPAGQQTIVPFSFSFDVNDRALFSTLGSGQQIDGTFTFNWSDGAGGTQTSVASRTDDAALTRILGGSCTPDNQMMCLLDGRFRVEIDWRNFAGETGTAQVSSRFDDGGTFWFFDPNNIEMFIQMTDQCGPEDRFWVFFSATTNVEFTVTVTDTEANVTNTYFNPLGGQAPSITDTSAFATCPGPSPVPAPNN